MENRTINISTVEEVAHGLQHFKDKMVFVGGSVVSLYADDPAADEIRPTKDIDLTLNVINLGHWQKIQEELAELGFYPDPQGQSICSYKFNKIPVDIMSTEDSPFGPSNPWYKIGFENLWTAKANTEEIKILSAPCFLATKFEAFNNRGGDYRWSHDLEDVIYVIDNRTSIVQEIKNDVPEIREFLRSEFKKFTDNDILEEILTAYIHPLMLEERMQLVIEKINQIIED
ncbi:nucleotidyl transferase AbiEii/AbiGii toxin family protein [Salegentibacter flavus]|uniref:Nucleotidyl transferase AbiEii toxin, Type IV TA system n=1 Tax=Salegentibacter flavus TaxID=287099 RepID=A0A1I4ZU90_9FLAO|nr:nucleotidyl transferase AbiEii/AbiGii toxin family protein [Salegentibacter flavus]SFN53802.1 hypothetical protein SAMN05660413_01527 [Salegentibacter flavus]